MNQNQEKPKDESQQVSQPAGEATGSDLPPEGQGGPHLPTVPLSEQFERGPDPIELAKGSETEQPVEEPHRCFVCSGPDHRACGCEAKERQRQIEQDDKSFRSQDIVNEERMEKELDREEANAEQILSKVFEKETMKQIIQMTGEMSGALMGGADKFEEFKNGVLDKLSDIHLVMNVVVSNTGILVKLAQDRADLLKDLKNVGANQN
jgi:hypothetical protein